MELLPVAPPPGPLEQGGDRPAFRLECPHASWSP